MSTDQSVEQQLIEQTRSQIRGLVSEIAQLAKSDLGPLEFYTEFLNRVVSALAAHGGAVWMLGEEGGLELQYQINLVDTNLASNQESLQQHGQLLHKVLRSGEGSLVAPRSGGADEQEAANPSEFLLVLGPLNNDQQTQGVVEVFQRPNAAATAQRGYLKFLLQMCELASDYLKTRRLRDFTDRQTLWLQLENFTRAAHASLDPQLTAYTIANEGRRLIDCDRVSVAIKKGNQCRIEAISGQDLFDKRSNTVALLNRLATAVVATGEPVWYTGDTTDMPPQVEDAVQAYVDDSHSKTVAVLPLIKPGTEEQKEDPQHVVETIGALIVEQIENARLGEGMLRRVDVVTDHSASALTNALEHQSLFLMPVWRTLGKARWVVQARTLPKTIAVAAAVLAAIVLLAVVPADLDLKGNATLQPFEQHMVFAAQDGVVETVPVEHGQLVSKGTVLATMKNTDLEAEEYRLTGELRAAEEQIRSLEQTLLREPSMPTADKVKLRGDKLKAEAAYASAKKRLEVIDEKKQQLQITCPMDGQVVTWDVQRLLLGRSVQKGQLLITVADPASEWELEIMMPEDRMGHVTRAQMDPDLGKQLRVRYILATDPNEEYQGFVKEVHYNAEVRGEEGNTVLIRSSLDPRQLVALREHMAAQYGLPQDATDAQLHQLVGAKLAAGELSTEKFTELTGLRPGAGARAKVHCGRASIGYVWFHDAISWIQRTWFTIW
jgi:multidrug efflux pump subunit AcrA (membrane-fusion protein)